MSDFPNYSEELELDMYIKTCRRMPPVERLEYAQRLLKQYYELMPNDAKRNFLRLRDAEAKEISDRFK